MFDFYSQATFLEGIQMITNKPENQAKHTFREVIRKQTVNLIRSIKMLEVNKLKKRRKRVIRKLSVVEARRRQARMQRFIAYFKKIAKIKNCTVLNHERCKSEMSSAYKITPNKKFVEDQKGQLEHQMRSLQKIRKEAGPYKIDYRPIFKNGKVSACGGISNKVESEKKEKTIHEALDLIMSSKSVINPELHLICDVVEELVKMEKLNFIVLNLYNLSDGFELFTKAKTKQFLCKMSYEGKDNWGGIPVLAPRPIDGPGVLPPKSTLWIRHSTVYPIQHSSFLDEIDRGEAPYKLLIMLKDLKDKFMYGNWIIIKVNDFITEAKDTMNRKISPFFSFFSLLKPSYDTLKLISRIKHRKTTEAELLLEFSDPLCLDPTPVPMYEKIKMMKNSLGSNLKLNEILQNKWQSTLAEARNTDNEPLSGFTGYLKTKQKIEDIVNQKQDFGDLFTKLPELCNESYSKIATMLPAPTFAEFLKKRTVKSVARSVYTFPILLEEFGFECIKVNEDGNRETIRRTFFSVFETKKGFYAKVHYPSQNKMMRPKVNCYEVPNVPQLNTHLVRHAKLVTSGECSNYLKVIHKLPGGAAYVAFDNIPFDPAQIKNKNDYRQDKDLNSDGETCENPDTDSEKNSKDNDSGVTSNRH